jgi:hypothetical protein
VSQQHAEIRDSVAPPAHDAPRCKYHVGTAMMIVSERRPFRRYISREADDPEPAKKMRLFWRCPVDWCPFVSAILEDDDGED